MSRPEHIVIPVMTDEWRVTWEQDLTRNPPYWSGHTEHKRELMPNVERAASFARFLSDRLDTNRIRVEHRRVTTWTPVEIPQSDESKIVDNPDRIV